MKYDMKHIPVVKGFLWRIEDGLIKFDSGEETLVFNETLTIVWKKIDGNSNIESICNELYEEYKSEQSKESIDSVVESSIEALLAENLIVVKEPDDFGGWFDYD